MKIELVTSLKRRATEIIRDLNKEHEPVLITEHGKPAAYLIDVQSFQEITKKRPEKKLLTIKKKTGGRNCYGRITARAIGGGHAGSGRRWSPSGATCTAGSCSGLARSAFSPW